MWKLVTSCTAATVLTQSRLAASTVDAAASAQFLTEASYDYFQYVADNCDTPTTTSAAAETIGQAYESKYAGKYANYGQSGNKQVKQFMCSCSKSSIGAKNENQAFSQCMNNMYGKDDWKNSNEFGNMNRYRKGGKGGSNTQSSPTTTVAEQAQQPEQPEQPEQPQEPQQPEEPEYDTPEASDADVPEEGPEEFETTLAPEDGNDAFYTSEAPGLEGSGAVKEMDAGLHVPSVTHSEYMSYLALFMICVGAIVFVAVARSCIRYTWHSWKLRSYEAIGESGTRTDELQSNKLKKHDRIRLPRKHPRRVETVDPVERLEEGNRLRYYDERATYTIGDV